MSMKLKVMTPVGLLILFFISRKHLQIYVWYSKSIMKYMNKKVALCNSDVSSIRKKEGLVIIRTPYLMREKINTSANNNLFTLICYFINFNIIQTII